MSEFIGLTEVDSRTPVTIRASAVVMVKPIKDGYGAYRTRVWVTGMPIDRPLTVVESAAEVRRLLGINER